MAMTEAYEAVRSAVANNYAPLPVELTRGNGVEVVDVNGRHYLDFLAGYSALNFGHRHPVLIEAATEQLGRLTMTSRAFNNDQLEPFCSELADFAGKEKVLPMNTGAEAVETAIKLARKWGYEVKGVPKDQANIIVAENNFHGRTTTIVSFSSDEGTQGGFGPFTPGFRSVKYGDIEALKAAADENTVAVLIEPIQGEAGVIIPPDGYLAELSRFTQDSDVLLVADEVQSGLGRTGKTFACDHEGVVPDVYIVGKALGGGIVPVSAVIADHEIMDVIHPGEHGSTFGGNPIAAAVGRAVVHLLETGEYQERAATMGEHLQTRLDELADKGITAVRRRGLWAGIDIATSLIDGHELCVRWARKGVLAKETHGQTVRLSPPLTVTAHQIDFAMEQLADVLDAAAK